MDAKEDEVPRPAEVGAPDELWSAVLAERPRAQRVARSRCSSPQDVEDVVQEALVRVVTMPNVDPARVGPLLATVVANLAADGHRARARAARAAPRLVGVDGHSTPEEQLCDLEEARWLWRCRHTLPTQDRAVLELRAQGRTVAQAAAELGLSYKAAESAYTRARSKMRSIWKATPALLAVLWGRPMRHLRGGSAAVLATSAAVVGFGFGLDRPNPPSTAPLTPRTVVSQPGTGHLPQDEQRPASPVPAADVAIGLPQTPAPSPGPPEPVIRSAPLRTGVVDGGDTRLMVREHDEESFQETVQRCLDKGIEVSLTRVECHD